MVDASVPLDENDAQIMELLRGRKTILLLNKSDLQTVISAEELTERVNAPVLNISAREETGLEELETMIKEMFFQEKSLLTTRSISRICGRNRR